MSPTPEQQAREHIDAALEAAGWILQDRASMNLAAGPGVAVREFKMASGHGFADYLLFVQGKAVGALEAKPFGYRLINVELQADKYANGLPTGLNPPVNPLPFLYLSTGVETRFINGLDPEPKTRAISANLPHIHRPETLDEWIRAETLDASVKRLHALEDDIPSYGPPNALPTLDWLGRLLLESDRPAEAAAAYERALARWPNRSASLLGLARSRRAMGEDVAAAEGYGRLLANWQEADPDLDALEEARAGAETDARS